VVANFMAFCDHAADDLGVFFHIGADDEDGRLDVSLPKRVQDFGGHLTYLNSEANPPAMLGKVGKATP
jgi:hypothetical protein